MSTLYLPQNVSWFGSYQNQSQVKKLFNHKLCQQLQSNLEAKFIRALFVPHAGLDYSGLCSAVAYNSVLSEKYRRVILLCTSHQVEGIYLPGCSLIKSNGFGDFKIDTNLIENMKELIEIGKMEIFENEHSFLNQLPFLSLMKNRPNLLPIICGPADIDQKEKIAKYIASTIDPLTLLICTSDLSHVNGHFEEKIQGQSVYDRIRQKDSIITSHLTNFHRQHNSGLEQTSACGQEAIKIFISILKRLNEKRTIYPRLQCHYMSQQIEGYLSEFDEFALMNRIQVDENRSCVSYASLIYSTEPLINPNQKRTMTKIITRYEQLQLLRYCVDNIFNFFENRPDEWLLPLDCPVLHLKRGLFVTIKNKDPPYQLRGCIGTIDANKDSILNNTAEYSLRTAFNDSRFPPMTLNELASGQYNYSISLLAPLKPISLKTYFDKKSPFHLGEDGIHLILPSGQSAYFLPSVAVDHNFSKKELLEQLCDKANQFDKNCYLQGQLEYNEGIEFGEERSILVTL